MDHNETGCQAPPEAPMLCVNNCGFFGSAATMNMCSKCHKDMVLKQEQAKLAASSIESIIEGSSSSNAKVSAASITTANIQTVPVESLPVSTPIAAALPSETDNIVKEAPNRCSSCRKRVGLTGFKCRCGNLFCSMHRYSDKHNCPFDYQTAARDAIAKSNPVIKPDKLDKI